MRTCTAVLTLCAAIPLAAGNIVTDWSAIASNTIVKNGGKGPGAASLWFAYTSLAVYDAVNAITGQYQPFYYHGAAPPNASVDAAAGAAAHRVLVPNFRKAWRLVLPVNRNEKTRLALRIGVRPERCRGTPCNFRTITRDHRSNCI